MAKEATMTREKKEKVRREKMWMARAMGFLDGIIAIEEERKRNAKAKLKTRKVSERKPA